MISWKNELNTIRLWMWPLDGVQLRENIQKNGNLIHYLPFVLYLWGTPFTSRKANTRRNRKYAHTHLLRAHICSCEPQKKKNLSVCLYTNSNIPFQILSSLYASFLTLSEDKTLTTTRTCFVYLILEMGKCQITKCPVACAHTHTLKRSTARERTLAVNINRKSV